MKAQEGRAKAGSRPIEQRLHTTVLQDTREFASVQEEWDELYESCPRATPFQSWEWLYSWWEVYGKDRYGLRLVTVRDEKILVGLLPLMVRRGRLLLLGDNVTILYRSVLTPYKDVLVREGWEEPVAQAGVRALKELDSWGVADL